MNIQENKNISILIKTKKYLDFMLAIITFSFIITLYLF